VPTGSSLAISPAAVDIDKNVKLVFVGGYHKGLPHYYGMFTLGKVLAHILTVYRYFALAVPNIHPGNRGLSSSGSDTKILSHLFNL
jgi:hypothetical protein